MKRLAKKLLASQGLTLFRSNNHDIVPKGNPKFTRVVRSLYALMKDSVLPSIPPLTEVRLRGLTSLMGLPVPQAVYIIDLLAKTSSLEGAVCEMGVAQGCTSRLIANELKDSTKELWLFDSFQGLPLPTAEDELINDILGLGSMKAYVGRMKTPRSLVEEKLAECAFPRERVHIVEGLFNETTSKKERLPTRCSFAFVDFDLYKPIKDALDYLNTALVAGGHVVVHDYDFFSSGAKKAVDQFVAQNHDAYEFFFPHDIAQGIVILKRQPAN